MRFFVGLHQPSDAKHFATTCISVHRLQERQHFKKEVGLMRYGSICSGIEAATIAVAPLGWEPVFYAEVEPFCCALLRHHYPHVLNVGDFTRIGKEVSVGTVDLVVGGTPCQSFSVAGRRAGLADPRGNLTLEYLALVDRIRPRWMVMENVPGLLSDDGGRTFGTILGILAECGYGFAWRIFDAQFAGVPQRRERVFLIAYLGDWRPPAAVLAERHSLSGHPAPGRETEQDVAACLTQGVDSQGKGGYAGQRREDDVNLVVAFADQRGRENGDTSLTDLAHTLHSMKGQSESQVVAFDLTQITSKENRCNPQVGDPCHPLASQQHAPLILAQNGSDIQINEIPGVIGANQAKQTSGDIVVINGNSTPELSHDLAMPLRNNDGSGNRQAIVIPLQEVNGRKSKNQNGTGIGIGEPNAQMYTLQSGQQHRVAALSFTERTRKDGRNLETITDTAYALCNPGSGGRAQSRQVLAPCLTQNYGKQPDNSDTGEGPMLIADEMMVRRLTPLECERLQGFPSIQKNVIIVVCQNSLEQQKNSVYAAIQSLKLPLCAGNVENGNLQVPVPSAGLPTDLKPLLGARHAVVNVDINYEAKTLVIHNHESCFLSVSFAEEKNLQHLPVPFANFVRLSAPIMQTLEAIIIDGKEESQRSIKHFSVRLPGRKYVLLSGHEIEEYARDVENNIRRIKEFLKCITLEAGSSFQSCDLILPTLSSSVVHAISSYIPDSIQTASSYELNISTTQGYTLIPYRGKPAKDSPRYRAIGNSFAVPVVRWIAQRIQQVEEVLNGR